MRMLIASAPSPAYRIFVGGVEGPAIDASRATPLPIEGCGARDYD